VAKKIFFPTVPTAPNFAVRATSYERTCGCAIHIPIKRSSDLANDLPPDRAAEANSLTFSVATIAGVKVRVTLPSDYRRLPMGSH